MLAHSKIKADLIKTCNMPPDTRSHAFSALASVFTLRPAFPYGHSISSRITWDSMFPHQWSGKENGCLLLNEKSLDYSDWIR